MPERVAVRLNNGKEKFIGLLDYGVLHLERERKKHLFRNLNAYGLDKHVLEVTLDGLCHKIIVSETDTGEAYSIPFATFVNKGVEREYKGHGAQILVPLKYWNKKYI